MEQLHVYTSVVYKKEIKYLKLLFVKLEQLVVPKPKRQKLDNKGDKTLLNEEVKQYIKD